MPAVLVIQQVLKEVKSFNITKVSFEGYFVP
jgi:hypothetical protein